MKIDICANRWKNLKLPALCSKINKECANKGESMKAICVDDEKLILDRNVSLVEKLDEICC